MKRPTKLIFFILAVFFSSLSCQKEAPTLEQSTPNTSYAVAGAELLFHGEKVHLNGVNALHTFGLEDLKLMDEWNVNIVREFIGNLREQPITGGPLQDTNGQWLHPLDQIVEKNRAHNKVTILCPFGWVKENGDVQLFTGQNPSEQTFYHNYKTKMRQIAEQFKGQEDVWIEIWNEPFHWNNEKGYSHQMWLNDTEDMVQNLRSVAGFESIIVVPGNEQGQGEQAIIELGNELLANHYNILFDLHAYEKWLNNNTKEDIEARFNRLFNSGFAFIIGEVGVLNVSELMDPKPFLEAAGQHNVSTLAWLWKREAEDQNALLNENEEANNLNNSNWGTSFYQFLNQ